MAAKRKMVTTVPRLVTQHKAPTPPAIANHHPPGEDLVWDTWSSHTFRAWGKALDKFASHMEYRPTLKETEPSSSFW